MTNELVEQLGFLHSKDDATKTPIISFETFLDLIKGPDTLAEAHFIERLMRYYEGANVRNEYRLTFTKFVEKVRNGVWEMRFAV